MGLHQSTRPVGLRLCALAAVVAGVISGCGGAHSRFTSHLQRGQDYLAGGNLDKAGVEFRNATQIEPKSSLAVYYNGRVAEARNNIRDAYGYYQAALELDAKNDAARAGMGKMLVFAGGAKRALDTIAPGLAAHPDNVDLLAVRAAAHLQLKDTDAARTDAKRAVELDPGNENAVTLLAALYSGDKDYPRAISLVKDALRRTPSSVPLHEVLTNIYLVSGDKVAAEAQMQRIIGLKPQELAPREQLALHLVRAGDLDGAQHVLEEAIQAFARAKQPVQVDEAKLLLVDFVSRERSREQGERTLRDFVARDPENSDLRLGLGALLQRTGVSDQALVVYQEVVDREGTKAKGLAARDRMAAIQVTAGHYDAANKLIAEVLQAAPRDNDALLLRSTMELRRNDATGAIADLRAVVRDQPNNVSLQRSLAAAYRAKGQPALAEEALRTAMRLAPNDVSISIELAQLLTGSERAAQAVSLLEDTVKRQPDSLPAREGLISTYLAAGNLTGAHDAAAELQVRQPQAAAGFYYGGLIAAREQHLDASQRDFEQALKLQPERLDVLAALVKVESARGNTDSAINRLHAALERNPDNSDLLTLLGSQYFERKNYAQATAAFERTRVLNPNTWQPHRNLAIVKLATNDVNGAVSEYQTALGLAPAEPQLVADAARLFEKQGKVDEAIARYEALYSGNPRTRQFAANNLAMLLVTYKTDRTSLDRARDLAGAFSASANGALLDTLGWVEFKRGEYKDALTVLERAADRSPDSRLIRFHLAMTQMQLGLSDRARTNLETALTGAEGLQWVDEARTALATLKARA